MLVSPLSCMAPFVRFGSPLQWYTSYPRAVTKHTPAMIWSTAVRDDTYVNVVSSQLTLFQTPQQPHCRLLPDLTSLHHSLHLPSPAQLAQLSPVVPTATCASKATAVPTMPAVLKVAMASTPATPNAAPEIRSCLYHIQAPDLRDITIPQEENPIWNVLGLYNIVSPTLRHRDIRTHACAYSMC